jgi:uncharacterized protein YndB with AHSA1/START domain
MSTPVGVTAAQSPQSRTGPDAASNRNAHVRVQVSAPVSQVWQALISSEGTATWLGEDAVLGGKGESYHCADGSVGVVRSFHPLEQLRLSWHSGPDAPASLIELDVTPEAKGTLVQLWHEGLPPEAQPEAEERWSTRLHAVLDPLAV